MKNQDGKGNTMSKKNNTVSKALHNKTVLITGGTGSFGSHVVEKLTADYTPKKIIIFSRDEKKQYDMRNEFKDTHIEFIIGDVREREQVFSIMEGVDYVFHAAALKQVPTCEFFPIEAVKTNILGANNVLDGAEANGVKKVVVLSTDKAVYPINAMGMTKALMEKLTLAKARLTKSKTVFCGVRYGNVMYSRGSVLPLFVSQIQKGEPITVTNPAMTRYLLPLPEAIDLVLFALIHGDNGDIHVRKSSAATVENIAKAMCDIFDHKKGIKMIGTREGEKLHETLLTREELMKAESYTDYYRIKTLASIDYDKYYTEGKKSPFPKIGYTSENTKLLSLAETVKLIRSIREIKELLS
ncbi:polysaccharide biosynthesis protein [Spirochaetota bacterium]